MRVAFGPFVFDSGTRELLADGRRVHLSPKAFDMLAILLEARPKVVSKSDLQDRIWGPGTIVGDASLTVVVAEIRHVLGDDSRDAKFVRTVHRVGYSFIGAATDVDEPPAAAQEAPASRCWLVWNGQTLPLAEGKNVVGRDPRSDVWIDASGVSRRHALIHVGASDVTIEDLGSSNGTFVGGRELTERRALSDGNLVELGTATVAFRMWSDGQAPETERIRRRISRRG
jgi:DNA-binding winged helix-turn-helix (wHTH) protein